MAEGARAIRFEAVEKRFPRALQPAVADVSLNVGDGAFVAVVGASGSGKTTLLKLVNRLLDPDRGRVLIGGRPVGESPPHVLRRGVGYVFQGVGLFPHLTVEENITITPRLLGWSREEGERRARELLDLVGLDEGLLPRRPDALSGGQRQRIGLARALAARPKIMLLDEPFGALDPVLRSRLARDYLEIHRRLGMTTLMITHDIAEALLSADRIAVMDAGRLVAEGTPAELLGEDQPRIVKTFLEAPRLQAEALVRLTGARP